MVCEGFFKLKSEIPDYLIWGYYMFPHAYTFRTFMYNEFNPINKFNSMLFADGHAVLKFYGMANVVMKWDLLIILSFTIGLQLIFAMVLQRYHTGLR